MKQTATKAQIDFVRDYFIRALPNCENAEERLNHALWLWEFLSKRGFGDQAKKEATKRENKNWLAELSQTEKQRLEEFRAAYGKSFAPLQRTALSWVKLDPISDEQYHRILAEAKREAAARKTRTSTPAYAERWLNERRWEDHTADVKTQQKNNFKQRLNSKLSELKHLETMRERAGNDELLPQIEKLRAEIEALKR